MIQYAVTARVTNEMGTDTKAIVVEGTDPDDVCNILFEQIRGVRPPTDLQILRVSEDLTQH